MALIKKIDVEEYLAARRAMRLGREKRVSQTEASRIKVTGKAAKATRFVGNLTPEHPSASPSSPSIAVSPDPRQNNLLRPRGSWQH